MKDGYSWTDLAIQEDLLSNHIVKTSNASLRIMAVITDTLLIRRHFYNISD